MVESFSKAAAGAGAEALVIGLGNPILGDDGVGIRVAAEIRRLLGPDSRVSVQEHSTGGLALMEAMVGFRRVILIDAMLTGACPPGTVRGLTLDEAGLSLHSSSSHDTTLLAALAGARRLGLPVPETVLVIGVEASLVDTFSTQLTGPVAAAVPKAVRLVLDGLCEFENENPAS